MGKDFVLIESDPFVQKLLVKLIEAVNSTTVTEMPVTDGH